MDLNSVTSGSFSRVAEARLSPRVIATWDPSLVRDPRLLVPVDVRALAVAPGEDVGHADVATTLLAGGEPGTKVGPPPFTDGTARPPGVYLHWALPDALTRGTGDETAGVQMRPLPDRWLVARLEPGPPRAVKAWVIESERARRVALEEWSEGEATEPPGLSAEQLTAVAGGDPAWAAVWDNVVDRFAMHDDLEGRFEMRDVAYLVAGWYSKPELDPICPTPGRPQFEELLRQLGWELDPRSLARLAAERRRRQEAAEKAGLEARPAGFAGIAAKLEPDLRASPGAVEGVAAGPELGEAVASERSEHAEAPWVPFPAAPAKLVGNARLLALALTPWSPSQTLYHGAIHGVTVDPGARLDPRPDAAALRLAAGTTGTEALARLTAGVLPGGDDLLEERLQTAFAYGLVARFDQTDGVPALEEELHARAFGSTPGGDPVLERVRSGDPLAAPAQEADAQARRVSGLARVAEAARAAVEFEWLGADRSTITDVLDLKTRPERLIGAERPITYETVRRAAPRFFYPQDPAICLEGLERSLRHGHDGIHTPSGALACRLSGDEVTALSSVVAGAELLAQGLEHGGIPPEVEDLLAEAALTDHTATDETAKLAAERRGLPPDSVRARLDAETRLRLRATVPGSDAARLCALSVADGVLPSPVALTPFRQAWVPLYLEWRLELKVDDRLDRWELSELDYEPGPAGAPGEDTVTVEGRSLLTASATKSLADQVATFLAEEDRLDKAGQGVVGSEDQKLLRAIGEIAGTLDVLAGGFDGLREQLLGIEDEVAIDPESPPAPSSPPRLIRGGVARLGRLRVVDAFGRALEIPPAQLAALDLGEGLRGPNGDPGQLYLPPRITSPARLQFRLLDAGEDDAEARIDQENPEASASPLCAWLLPDHVDDALEFFDPTGEPQGQLRHDLVTQGVVWEGAPGVPAPLGAGPAESMNRHAAALATALVQRDAADRAARGARSESPLSALLRVIDTTLWTVDPFGTAGREYFASLTGRPIAIVRASLLLDVPSDANEYPQLSAEDRDARDGAFRALAARSFDVRLGALTRFDDGLLGYFIDDDYTRFFPVHAKVPEEALPAGRHTGFLERADATPAETGALEPRPIRQPWIVSDPTVAMRPNRPVRLTMLMDPGASVHATSGILPRKSIALLRDWTAEALARISPSFRIGPALVDPSTIRLPVVSALPKRQSWTRRDSPTTWRDDPIVAATQEAMLPDQPATAQEGYVRARIEPEDSLEPPATA
jgi:hypothetical protein